MTNFEKLTLLWGGFVVAIVLGVLLPATQTTIFVVGCLMGIAWICAPLMATNKNRKDNTDA